MGKTEGISLDQRRRGVLGAGSRGVKCPRCKQFAPLRPDGKYVCPLCGATIERKKLPPTT